MLVIVRFLIHLSLKTFGTFGVSYLSSVFILYLYSLLRDFFVSSVFFIIGKMTALPAPEKQ